jgi:predicted NUDIX family NTP pyrophosphohydrolase
MTARSAGILLYRQQPAGELQVFLIHMGGPYWSHKDAGAWSIPKGEYGDEEQPLQAARREFEEETGAVLDGSFLPLESIRQRNGKQVTAWAVRGDFDPAQLRSNLFSLEWPPRSGKIQQFPEADRCDWFSLADARSRMISGQALLLDRLLARLGSPSGPQEL